MLTLEEAVAELDKLLAFGWIEDRVGTRVNADEIRAAVKTVALAAVELTLNVKMDAENVRRVREVRAELDRLLEVKHDDD